MSKGYLVESDVENLALDTLGEVGYNVFKSPSPTTPNAKIDAMRSGDHTVAVLPEKIKSALRRLNPGYSDNIYGEAYRQLIRLADNPDMMINNHYFHKLLIEGIRVKTSVKGENRTETLYPIDFNHVENNEFIATNQFTFKESHERRPDTTLFINGLPVVTFEFKDASNPNVSIQNAYQQLKEYFQGERQTFQLPLAPKGTPFQQKVWNTLQIIPYGKTWSYLQMAKAIGNPKACRAVGMANHRNPIGIIIPCHRVIGSNGDLVGYASGLDMKRYLLNLEKETLLKQKKK